MYPKSNSMKRIWNFLFSPDTGYFLKYKYFYYKGVPNICYEIHQGFRFLGIPMSDRMAFCYDMNDVNHIAKTKNITIK